ncbi:MAG: cytochrome c biogenesis protein, partial [Cyanobacteria bacterium J06632_3]
DIDELQERLSDRRYKVFEKSPDDSGEQDISQGAMLYAHKGLSGRIGPIVVHASMLLILAGAILGSMTGFFAQEMVPSGQTFKVQNIFDAGPWSKPQIPKDWSVHVNRFWIDYSPEGRIDQFYSDLSVLDAAGEEVKRKTIWVNQPLRYKNVTLYQADWAVGAVKVRINNSPIFNLQMAPLPVEGGRVWGTWVPTKPDMSEGISVVAQDLQGTVLLYDMTGKLVSTVREGGSAEVNGVTLFVDELIGSTGLQIKADPGIPVVYLGFGLLMIGVVMSYISHSQVWALQAGDKLFVGGRTNRAQVSFERELLAILDEVSQTDAADIQEPAAPALAK